MPSFELDPAFERDLSASLAVRLDAMGHASVSLAKANTPDSPETPGAQARDSIEYEVDRDRLAMRFGSQLLKFRFLEIGTVHYEPRAPLRRTADELGPDYLRIARGR